MLRRRTYLGMRATTSMEQEHTWAIWGKVEAMSTLRMPCKTGLRCWNAYLGWRELPAVTGQLVLEGPEANLGNWCWRANTAAGKAISSANQLAMNGKRLQIQLPECFQRGAILGGWVRNLLIETKLFLPIRGTVLRKTWKYPYILRQEVTDIAKLFKMVHCSSRSKFWRLSLTKISKFFHGGIWRKIFWEINYWGI